MSSRRRCEEEEACGGYERERGAPALALSFAPEAEALLPAEGFFSALMGSKDKENGCGRRSVDATKYMTSLVPTIATEELRKALKDEEALDASLQTFKTPKRSEEDHLKKLKEDMDAKIDNLFREKYDKKKSDQVPKKEQEKNPPTTGEDLLQKIAELDSSSISTEVKEVLHALITEVYELEKGLVQKKGGKKNDGTEIKEKYERACSKTVNNVLGVLACMKRVKGKPHPKADVLRHIRGVLSNSKNDIFEDEIRKINALIEGTADEVKCIFGSVGAGAFGRFGDAVLLRDRVILWILALSFEIKSFTSMFKDNPRCLAETIGLYVLGLGALMGTIIGISAAIVGGATPTAGLIIPLAAFTISKIHAKLQRTYVNRKCKAPQSEVLTHILKYQGNPQVCGLDEPKPLLEERSKEEKV